MLPPGIKKWGMRIALPLAALVSGAVAWAGGLTTFQDKQVLTADALNGNFAYLASQVTAQASAVTALQAQVTALAGSTAISAEMAAGMSFMVAVTTFTAPSYTKVDWDELGEFSAPAGFVPQSTGIYEICASVAWPVALNSELDVFVNGTRLRGMGQGSLQQICGGCVDVSLVAGDNAQVQMFQASAATQTVVANPIWSYLNIHRVY